MAKRTSEKELDETSAPRDLIEYGREVVSLEIEGLRELERGIGPACEKAVRLLLVCGIGKSGIVARKIAATLSSTGTPSVYLHPVEAVHGDMGMLTEDDVFLAISKSGSSEEIAKLLPYLKTIRVKVVSITATTGSGLAEASDVVLLTSVGREACPMDVVPTTSTTAAMVLGDALAVAAFRSRDFGKDAVPVVAADTPLREALVEIVDKRLGCTGIVDRDGRLVGIITDGDLKRILIKNRDAFDEPVEKLMTSNPRTITPDTLAIKALEKMEIDPPSPITQLFVVDGQSRPLGVVHIHDIIRAGLK
jgi:arabinose-5-phosphate isomerase